MQREIVQSDADLIFIGGGWGSGKSTAASLRFLRTVSRNPWIPKLHGQRRPRSIVLGPTETVLHETMIPMLQGLLRPGDIAVEHKSRPFSWTLRTGHEITFRSFRGTVEGANLCALLADESHMITKQQVFTNLLERARDPRAVERVTIFCGLPMDGLLRTKFDRHPEPAGQRHWLLSTFDNTFLPPAKLERYREDCPSQEEILFLRGQWIQPFDAVFHTFSSALEHGNLTAERGNRDEPVQVALDVGDASFALFAQKRKVACKTGDGRVELQDALLIVDHLPVNNAGTTEDVCKLVKARGWKIVPGASRFYTDPTIRPDEIASIRRVFPGIEQVRASGQNDPRYSIDYGIDAIKRAFRDSLGNRRLMISAHLADPKREFDAFDPTRGIVQCITRSVINPATGLPSKQNRKEEHGRDCLRYLVAFLLPIVRSGGARVVNLR